LVRDARDQIDRNNERRSIDVGIALTVWRCIERQPGEGTGEPRAFTLFGYMPEWIFAQTNPTQQLARLHHFSTKKLQDGQEVEFVITVREYVTPPDPGMKYFASTDKQTNQRVLAYTPSGWGDTMLKALSECLNSIERFPYEGD
jgi:hypothetical protein